MTVLAVTGLKGEAKIAGGEGVVALAGGSEGLTAKLAALHGDIKAVISFGLAGALSPGLAVGAVIVASEIVSDAQRWDADARWRDLLAARISGARTGLLAGSEAVLMDAAAKAALLEKTGALAVDMESHAAAHFAASRKLPFVALRVISDDAMHALPPAALVAMKPDGGIALGPVLWSVTKNPAQIGALIATARASNRAFAELLRCRDLCGPGLACPYV